jgi:hypothetical protein
MTMKPDDAAAKHSLGRKITPRRKILALAIAAAADAIQVGLFPAFVGGAASVPDDVLDAVVALALIATLGFRWRLVLALLVELVPALALFPSWTLFVATLPAAPGAHDESGDLRR